MRHCATFTVSSLNLNFKDEETEAYRASANVAEIIELLSYGSWTLLSNENLYVTHAFVPHTDCSKMSFYSLA